MAPSNIAIGVLTVTALVYASSSLLLGRLMEAGEETLPEDLLRKHKVSAYVSVALSFVFVGLSLAFLLGAIISGVDFELFDWQLFSDGLVMTLGSLSLLIAVTFPSYAAVLLCADIIGEISDFERPG